MSDLNSLLTITESHELTERLKDSAVLRTEYRKLLTKVYNNDDLEDQRQTLRAETLKLKVREGSSPESTAPESLESISDQELQIILHVRRQLAVALVEARANDAEAPADVKKSEYDQIAELIIDLEDGDLAYKTYSTANAKGDTIDQLFGWPNYADAIKTMQFSPEQQLEIVEDQAVFLLAQNPHLTDATQLAIFEQGIKFVTDYPESSRGHNLIGQLAINNHVNNPEVLKRIFEMEGEIGDQRQMDVVFSDRENLPEDLVEKIKDDDTLRLIWNAKLSPSDETSLIKIALKSNDLYFQCGVLGSATLHNEGIVRIILEDPNLTPSMAFDLKRNPNLSAKYPDLAEEVKRKYDALLDAEK